jgi:hypothetical protein
MKRFSVLLLSMALIIIFPGIALCQSALGDLETAAGQSISTVNVPAVSAPSAVSSVSSVAKAAVSSSSTSMSTMVTGMVMQSLLNNLFSPTPQKSQAQIEAEKAEQERLAAEAEAERQAEIARQQAIHDKLINSSKTLDGSGSLDFKSLDGDMEKMRSDAAKQFESNGNGGTSGSISKGNDFFGVPLSEPDIQTLVEPESNPVFSDVKTAVEVTDDYLEKDKQVVKIIGGKVNEAKGEPIVPKVDCAAVSAKLARYETDMMRFHQWNNGTLHELKDWEKKNDDAFWNAVKDGSSAAFSTFTDYLEETRSSATMIKNILENNEQKYVTEKIFSADQISQYKKLLDQRIATCNVSKVANNMSDVMEYTAQTRNLVQGTTEKLQESDASCREVLKVMKEKGLVTDYPWVEAGQFLTGELINKFMHNPSILLKSNSILKHSVKIPYVTVSQLVVDETYNATDWLTSFNNVCTFRDADGKATEAIKKIQNDMDNMKIELQGCPLAK